MKFSRVLFFASLALAAPAILVEKSEPAVLLDERQNDPVSTVITSLNSVSNTVGTSVGAIQTAVKGIKGAVDAQVRILISANLDAILAALNTAKTTIVGSTVDSAGTITTAVGGLTQAQIDNLSAAVQGALKAVNQLKVIASLTATDLTPDVFNLVNGQISAIESAIAPLVKPVATFANAVSKANAKIGINVLGLGGATATLVSTVNDFLTGLGLGGLGNLVNCILFGTNC